jgi:hypothetical protein
MRQIVSSGASISRPRPHALGRSRRRVRPTHAARPRNAARRLPDLSEYASADSTARTAAARRPFPHPVSCQRQAVGRFPADSRGRSPIHLSQESTGEYTDKFRRAKQARTAVSEERSGQRRDGMPRCDSRKRDAIAFDSQCRWQRKSGGACPIGTPARREGGWNPEGSVRDER